MDYLYNIVTNLISWVSLQWQSNLFRISFAVVILVIILAIAFVAILNTKKESINEIQLIQLIHLTLISK